MYRELVRALEEDIRDGVLKPGDRLPTHRQLAAALDLARGTVARAYDEAARLGLVESGVGQGTFVSHSLEVQARHEAEATEIDFGIGYPIHEVEPDPAPVLQSLAGDRQRFDVLRYPQPEGRREHRAAGARWCRRFGVEVDDDDVLLALGGQHAIYTWLAATFERGQTLLVGEYTYRMAATAAQSLGIVVRGVAMDGEGLRIDALREAIDETGARGLYVMPTVQNPTGVTMSRARREALAEVVREHRLRVLEDDIHGPLADDPPPPLKTLEPTQVTYLASLSKSVAGGLRIAYVAPPRHDRPRLLTSVVASVWSPPPLTAEIARRWIDDGTAERVVEAKRREAAVRIDLLRRHLEPTDARLWLGGYYGWLEMPPDWSASTFARAARRRDVIVIPAEVFYVGAGRPMEAVRVAVGGTSRARVEEGARRLAEILTGPPPVIVEPIL